MIQTKNFGKSQDVCDWLNKHEEMAIVAITKSMGVFVLFYEKDEIEDDD